MGVTEMGLLLVLFVLGGGLFLGPGLISAFIAHRKGYRPWFWLLSMGLIGTVVTLIIPGLGKATTPEERDRWESRADWAGGLMSGFTFFSLLALPLMAALFFVGASRAAPAMRPMAPIAAPSGTMEEDSMETLLESVPQTLEVEPEHKKE
ncbi:MAG TPA: hypothetical protein VGM98_20345 [Schlesneria sp.]|jgi:hypothetical protein